MFEKFLIGVGSFVTEISYGSVYEIPSMETFVLTRKFALELLDDGFEYRHLQPLVGRRVRFEDGEFGGKPYRFLELAKEASVPR